MGRFTSLLFARPSFAEGMARLLDLGGTLNEYNRSETGEEADLVAFRSDWEALGDDFRTAWGAYADSGRASQAAP